MDKNLLRKLAGIETKPPQQVSESSFNRIRELAGLSALPVKENKDKEEDLDMPADDKEEMPDDEVVDNNEMPAGEEGEDELPEIIKDLAAQAAGKSDEELEDLMIQIYQAGVKDGEEKQEKVTEMYYYDDPSTMSPEQRREYNRRKNKPQDPLGNRPVGGVAKHGDELKKYLRGTKPGFSGEERPSSAGLDAYQRGYTAKFSGPKGKLPEDVEIDEMYYYDDPSTMSPEQRREYHRRKNKPQDSLGNRPAGAIARHGNELKSMLQGPESRNRYQKDFTAKFSGPKGRLPEDVQVDEMWYSPNVRITFVGKDISENRKIASRFGKIVDKNEGGMWSPIYTTYTIVPSMHLTKIKEELNKLKVKATAEYEHSSSSRDDLGGWSVSQSGDKMSEDVQLEEGQKSINRQIKSLGSEKLIDTPNFKVVELKTKEAAQLYAAGTKWNIAAKTDKANTFDQYHAEGPIYVIIAKLDGQMKKFAFHPASRTFVDENDEKPSKATANKLTEFPEYEVFWKKLATRWHTANSTPY